MSSLLKLLGLLIFTIFEVIFLSRVPNMILVPTPCCKGCVKYIPFYLLNHLYFVAHVTQCIKCDTLLCVKVHSSRKLKENDLLDLFFPKQIC